METTARATLNVDILLHVLTLDQLGWAYPELARFRSVSTAVKVAIDTSPNCRAAKLYWLALTREPEAYSYYELKRLRAVSLAFREIIESSPGLAPVLFRSHIRPNVRHRRSAYSVGELKLHPILEEGGNVEICVASFGKVALYNPRTGSEWRLADYPALLSERASYPPVVRVRITGDVVSAAAVNEEGVTVKEVIELFLSYRKRYPLKGPSAFRAFAPLGYNEGAQVLALTPLFHSGVDGEASLREDGREVAVV